MSKVQTGVVFDNCPTSVLIVGAGPTGLALACDLRMRGVDVTIIDKAHGPATTSRAFGLQPRGIEILQRLGALGDLPQRAVNAVAMSFHSDKRPLFRFEMRATDGVVIPTPLLIGQAEIEAQLRARLRQLEREVTWGTELVAADQDESGINIILQSDAGHRGLRADWLVGCDGSHSKTRKLAGISFEGSLFPEKFLLADVRMDWSRSHHEPAVWLHANGMFAALPLPGTDTWRIMAELPTDSDTGVEGPGQEMPATAAIGLIQRFLKERVGDTTTEVTDPIWVSVFRFHRRLASTYRRRRILLAGDAAHIHSPFGGQGMNTGLGDAHNLGWKLALVVQGRASPRLLDTYEAERRPVAADVLKSTTTNTSLLLGNNVLSKFIRDFLFIPALRRPAVQRKFQAKNSQLNVNYRRGPLARRFGLLTRIAQLARSRPEAGDRAPDAPCLALPAGYPTRLAEQTSAGWALLTFGGDAKALSACAATVRSRLGKDIRVVRILDRGAAKKWRETSGEDVLLEDQSGAVAELYRPSASGVVLVRPDGHLAWRCDRPNVASLTEWLKWPSIPKPRAVCRELSRPSP